MLKQGVCPLCSSREIMENVRVIDRAHGNNTDSELTVGVYHRPDPLTFRNLHQSRMRAWICGSCGYAELFVEDPKELLAIYRDTQ